MKKVFGIVLVLMLVVALAGCSAGSEDIKMGKADFAAHGNKSFAVAVVALDGDTIVGATIDEYQFMGTDVAEGVPNSDGGFGENFPEGMILGSKRTNADYYSDHMAEAAGATKRLDDQYDEIQQYVTGKTIDELEEVLADNDAEGMIDEVSTVTLVDTKGYVEAFVAAAKNAK